MIQYFIDHPIWIAVFAAVVLLTVFVCFKAAQAGSRRYAANEKTIKKIKEENELMNEFSILTESLVAASDSARLFKGVALNLQKRVADKADIMAEFDSLTDGQKEIYALLSVVDDGETRLSAFFEACGKPLTEYALSAVSNILEADAVDTFRKEYDAFDGDNETVSFIPDEIKKLDESFKSLAPIEKICAQAGDFIKKNPEKFI